MAADGATLVTPRPCAVDRADPMLPRPFRVRSVRRDTRDTVTLELVPLDGAPLAFTPGQFTMLSAFGVGEVPISISGDPARPQRLVHTVRDVGGVTRSICAASPGDVLGVRGPYGHGWRVTGGRGGDVVVVAGGIGLAPLRPAVLELLAQRDSYGSVTLCYGTRSPNDLLFPDDLRDWADRGVEVAVTVDRADHGWTGRVGTVTAVLPQGGLTPDRTICLVCGPEVMMRHVADALVARGVPPAQVRLSMERNMQCGVGLCGHCQLREHLVCVDGPVLGLDRVRRHFAVREL